MFRFMKLSGLIAFLMTLIFLQSCGSSKLNVDYHSPTVRFETPETTGKTMGLKVQAGFGSAHKVSLVRSRQTKDFINQNPSSVVIDTNTEFEVTNNLGYGADLGVFSRFDLMFSKRMDSHYRLGGKFQFLGSPSGKDIGLKASIMGSYGYHLDKDVSKSGIFEKQEDEFTTVTGKAKLNSMDAGLLLGYRFAPQLLVYTLAYQEENRASATVSIQNQSDTSVAKKFLTKGINLGAEVSQGAEQNMFILLEGGLSEIKEEDAVLDMKTRHRSYGIAAGARF